MSDRFLRGFPEALLDGTAAIFLGAGTSMAAGYPSWEELLEDIADELGLAGAKLHDLAALAQWSVSESGAARVRGVIRDKIGQNRPIPPAVKTVAQLPFRHLWTTNYDRLVERAFEELGRPVVPISNSADLSLPVRAGTARLYKMHGSVEHLDGVVISTEDYELFRRDRGAYVPLLQAHLTSMSMLFVGLSFSDPNLKHVFATIRESFTDAPPEHYAIVKTPAKRQDETDEQFKARQAQHNLWTKDLKRYGLHSIEIADYAEIDQILNDLRRAISRQKVWVSGSYPTGAGETTEAQFALAEKIGKLVAQSGKALVSGSGLTVGSAAIAGFLSGLSPEDTWRLGQKLFVRHFPQPVGKVDFKQHWRTIREELARESGIVIFVAGEKEVDGRRVMADGVLEEYDLALANGSFLLPVGSSGGAARKIAERLLGSILPSDGPSSRRPTDSDLASLLENDDHENIIGILQRIFGRLQ